MEAIVKPFLHELISGLDNPKLAKEGNTYGYLLKAFMFFFALIETLAVGDNINILAEFGIDNISNEVMAIAAALLVSVASKQVHDLAQFVRLAIANRGKPSTEVIEEF